MHEIIKRLVRGWNFWVRNKLKYVVMEDIQQEIEENLRLMSYVSREYKLGQLSIFFNL